MQKPCLIDFNFSIPFVTDRICRSGSFISNEISFPASYYIAIQLCILKIRSFKCINLQDPSLHLKSRFLNQPPNMTQRQPLHAPIKHHTPCKYKQIKLEARIAYRGSSFINHDKPKV